jgi:hypothetical protein
VAGTGRPPKKNIACRWTLKHCKKKGSERGRERERIGIGSRKVIVNEKTLFVRFFID